LRQWQLGIKLNRFFESRPLTCAVATFVERQGQIVMGLRAGR
jgi:hypothetical protein